MPMEPIGMVRPLLPFEYGYFSYMENHYKDLPTIRNKPCPFKEPPRTWLERYQELDKVKVENEFYKDIAALQEFSSKYCKDAQRHHWRKVLEPLELGSETRFIWALLFLKSTNGVADVVSCGHFQAVIAKHPPLTLEVYKNPQLIASILRQTSKWVKNTVSKEGCF
jgi:hypothetical protein